MADGMDKARPERLAIFRFDEACQHLGSPMAGLIDISLYEVIGGSLQLGEEVLRKGDGFFLPAGTAYAFAEGVEVLEFRHEPLRDTVIQANNPVFWEKARETVRESRDRWAAEGRPA